MEQLWLNVKLIKYFIFLLNQIKCIRNNYFFIIRKKKNIIFYKIFVLRKMKTKSAFILKIRKRRLKFLIVHDEERGLENLKLTGH